LLWMPKRLPRVKSSGFNHICNEQPDLALERI
jgi:hypothetical protein